jgi:5-methylcytosine-specific restriction endonuclease McrA
MMIHWPKVGKNTQVTCYLACDMHFEPSGLELPSGTRIDGIFIGSSNEENAFHVHIQSPEHDCTFAFLAREITANLLNVKQCFRCEWHLSLDEFKRHSLIVDKSPILTEVCSDCYRRLKNKVAEHDSHARRFGGDYTLKVSEWIEILKACEGRCHYCKKQVGYEQLIMEHMTPLSWEGANSKENVVPACISCNSSKGGRDVKTWRRHNEARILLEKLQEYYGVGKFEVTNLAIKTLAQTVGISVMEDEV